MGVVPPTLDGVSLKSVQHASVTNTSSHFVLGDSGSSFLFCVSAGVYSDPLGASLPDPDWTGVRCRPSERRHP